MQARLDRLTVIGALTFSRSFENGLEISPMPWKISPGQIVFMLHIYRIEVWRKDFIRDIWTSLINLLERPFR